MAKTGVAVTSLATKVGTLIVAATGTVIVAIAITVAVIAVEAGYEQT